MDESIVHTARSTLYVDGKLLGRVPRIAICQSPDTPETLLLFCDEEWNSLGVVACASIDEARKRAESEYQGIATKWIDANVSEEQAARYIDEQWRDERCSFCGKSPDQVQRMVSASKARICDSCVKDLFQKHNRDA
jgi:hypothetical protein